MNNSIRPVFTLELEHKLVPGLITLGKYDGTHPCLTAATTADKILIHSPHRRPSYVAGRMIWSESNREIAMLNVNQSVTALVAGPLIPNDDHDILIIGTPTHVLAYHVHDNKDVFYIECQDGVKAITSGYFRDNKQVLVFVGGNSSVHGYDHNGCEMFWTAVGDVVTALILLDYNKDGMKELIASSEDFNIRVFKGDQTIAEHAETEVVTGLVALPENRFAYSVSNGTVGVYDQDVRLWRVKSKNFAVAMYSYDLLGKGATQLVTGWSNGKIDCRSITTGEVLFKDSMPQGAAGVVEGDYRSIGKTDLICVSTEGEGVLDLKTTKLNSLPTRNVLVRGYTTTKSLSVAPGTGQEQDVVRELLAEKQALLMELKQYESNTRFNEKAYENLQDCDASSGGVIPATTRLQIGISTNTAEAKPHVELYVSTNNNTIIKAVIVFAEGIFKGETHVIHPPASKLSSELSVPLQPPKDRPVDIHIKTLVGYPQSTQFHVFEITRQLPRFSMYALLESKTVTSQSYVEFKINERLQRICIWINQNFLFPDEFELTNERELKVHMKSLRDGKDLLMTLDVNGKVLFKTDNLLLASDLVQSLAVFLNLDGLQSRASFPEEEEKLRANMEKLTEIQEARLQLSSDVADRLRQIRELVVRAEDCRINCLNDMPSCYNELRNLNKELINGYNIRLKNYEEGVETMKTINGIIQRASRLRVGQYSANVISAARAAIKANSVEGLVKIMRTGELH